MRTLRDMIEQFWDCSIKKDFTRFPFKLFFTIFHSQLYEKISLHGLLTLDDYILNISKYYDLSVLEDFVYNSEHTNRQFTLQSILEAIFLPRWEHFREKHRDNIRYKGLIKLLDDIKEYETLDDIEKILLVDRCIHAQHNSGAIVNLDISAIKKEYEERIESLKLDKAFGILTRNGLEEVVKDMKSFNAIFLDLDNIHTLNKNMGYLGVNKLIKKIFYTFKFRGDDIIGRWFSGDEIVIVSTKKLDKLLTRLQNHFYKYGITFKYQIFYDLNTLEELESLLGVNLDQN